MSRWPFTSLFTIGAADQGSPARCRRHSIFPEESESPTGISTTAFFCSSLRFSTYPTLSFPSITSPRSGYVGPVTRWYTAVPTVIKSATPQRIHVRCFISLRLSRSMVGLLMPQQPVEQPHGVQHIWPAVKHHAIRLPCRHCVDQFRARREPFFD